MEASHSLLRARLYRKIAGRRGSAILLGRKLPMFQYFDRVLAGFDVEPLRPLAFGVKVIVRVRDVVRRKVSPLLDDSRNRKHAGEYACFRQFVVQTMRITPESGFADAERRQERDG